MRQPYTDHPPVLIFGVSQGGDPGTPRVRPVWRDSKNLELDYSHSDIDFEAVKFDDVSISVKRVP
ncbi:MAG: hypothetical protein ACRED8_12155 [Caulobacteraceae bacterium]